MHILLSNLALMTVALVVWNIIGALTTGKVVADRFLEDRLGRLDPEAGFVLYLFGWFWPLTLGLYALRRFSDWYRDSQWYNG